MLRLSEDRLQEIIDSKVEGTELVLFEQAGNRRRRILRLYVDHPEGVTHELCARVSAAVSEVLDEAEGFTEPYTLEVSSPGIERPLRKQSHFEAQLGKTVYVKTKMPIEGGKVWQGTLVEVGADAIVVEDSGRKAKIPLCEIADAHLKCEFG
jgi:ribosome maturation factor RimP